MRGSTPRRLAVTAVVVLLAAVAAVGTATATGMASRDLPTPSAPPEEVRHQADEVLARPEFQRPEPNVVEKAQSWLQEQLGRVLQHLVSGDGASVLGWLILVAAISAIIFFVARLSRTVQADPRHETGVSVERSRTAHEWDAEAERLEDDGRWKEALRCRFRALVATLVACGLVDDVPGRTTGEYRSEVSVTLPDAADAFARTTRIFEAAWYGNEDTGPDENRAFRVSANEVVHAVSANRAPAAVAVSA